LIEDCHDCEFEFHCPITTHVLEVWRSNNCNVIINTQVYTLQADLCENLKIVYEHKTFLGSLVQAGIQGLTVEFRDYSELNFKSGVTVLKEEDPNLDEKFDQFITRFVKELENKLTTEKIVRLENGFHTTDREKEEWDAQKEKDDLKTEEAVRKMLKLAGPAMGMTEESVSAKSKEGKAEKAAKLKKEQQSNLKKQHGNNAFAAKKYPEAIKHYSEAISIYPENHILYCNRSTAYFETKQFDLALEDAQKCTELEQDFVKGHFRKGAILLELKKTQEAVEVLRHAHDLSPKDEEILSLLEKARSLL